MNRPFYAFGALLFALALAMVAVSSTSRSTSVSREAVATPHSSVPAAASSASPARAARFCGILVVLPAEDEFPIGVAEAHFPFASRMYDPDSSVDWFPDVAVCGSGECPLIGNRSVSLVVQPIQTAEYDPTRLRDESSRDCRSHYDPAYDNLVYGEVDGTASSGRPLTSNKPEQISSAAVGWKEYAELMDKALALDLNAEPKAESIISVRSSRLLLDFAASTLRQTGQLMQFAADELQHSAPVFNQDQLAEEQSVNQR